MCQASKGVVKSEKWTSGTDRLRESRGRAKVVEGEDNFSVKAKPPLKDTWPPALPMAFKLIGSSLSQLGGRTGDYQIGSGGGCRWILSALLLPI